MVNYTNVKISVTFSCLLGLNNRIEEVQSVLRQKRSPAPHFGDDFGGFGGGKS